jgi:hypothetical protein
VTGLVNEGAVMVLTGGGLAAPEVMVFATPRCVSARPTRVTCVGTRGETVTFKQKRGTSMYSFTVRAGRRTFQAPLGHASVELVLSLGSVDLSGEISQCKLGGETAMACKR